jgi:hypothetical protein
MTDRASIRSVIYTPPAKERPVNPDQFEIIDTHIHAWTTGGMTPYLSNPHAPAAFGSLEEKVFKDTLDQMDQLGICQGCVSNSGRGANRE